MPEAANYSDDLQIKSGDVVVMKDNETSKITHISFVEDVPSIQGELADNIKAVEYLFKLLAGKAGEE